MSTPRVRAGVYDGAGQLTYQDMPSRGDEEHGEIRTLRYKGRTFTFDPPFTWEVQRGNLRTAAGWEETRTYQARHPYNLAGSGETGDTLAELLLGLAEEVSVAWDMLHEAVSVTGEYRGWPPHELRRWRTEKTRLGGPWWYPDWYERWYRAWQRTRRGTP